MIAPFLNAASQRARRNEPGRPGRRVKEHAASLAELNDIFAMIERMRAVDTEGVEPLMHTNEEPCRLREDEPVSISAQKRDACLALAPQVVNGMFVVPKVVE